MQAESFLSDALEHKNPVNENAYVYEFDEEKADEHIELDKEYWELRRCLVIQSNKKKRDKELIRYYLDRIDELEKILNI